MSSGKAFIFKTDLGLHIRVPNSQGGENEIIITKDGMILAPNICSDCEFFREVSEECIEIET